MHEIKEYVIFNKMLEVDSSIFYKDYETIIVSNRLIDKYYLRSGVEKITEGFQNQTFQKIQDIDGDLKKYNNIVEKRNNFKNFKDFALKCPEDKVFCDKLELLNFQNEDTNSFLISINRNPFKSFNVPFKKILEEKLLKEFNINIQYCSSDEIYFYKLKKMSRLVIN